MKNAFHTIIVDIHHQYQWPSIPAILRSYHYHLYFFPQTRKSIHNGIPCLKSISLRKSMRVTWSVSIIHGWLTWHQYLCTPYNEDFVFAHHYYNTISEWCWRLAARSLFLTECFSKSIIEPLSIPRDFYCQELGFWNCNGKNYIIIIIVHWKFCRRL